MELVLKEIQEQLGQRGMQRVLLDSLRPEQLDGLARESGAESEPQAPAGQTALALATLATRREPLALQVSRILDDVNEVVTVRLSQVSDEVLKRYFSPGNPHQDIATGRLLWGLFRLAKRRACQELLRVWIDHLASATQALSADQTEIHIPDESLLARTERDAIASLEEKEKPSTEASSHALTDELDRIMADELTGLPSADSPALPEEGIKASSALNPEFEKPATDFDKLYRSVERLDQRLDAMQALFYSLREDLDKLKSEHQTQLSSRVDTIVDLLTSLRDQVRSVESRLDGIGSAGVSEDVEVGLSETEPLEVGLREPSPEVEEIEAVSVEEAEVSSPSALGSVPSSEESSEPFPSAHQEPADEWSPGAPERSKPSDGVAQSPDSGEPLTGTAPEKVFQSETIVIVGGVDKLESNYRAVIEQLGGRSEWFSSVNEFSPQWLEELVDRAHLLIVLGNVVSHPGVLRLTQVANRLGRRLFIHHSTAPTSLRRFLFNLVERERI